MRPEALPLIKCIPKSAKAIYERGSYARAMVETTNWIGCAAGSDWRRVYKALTKNQICGSRIREQCLEEQDESHKDDLGSKVRRMIQIQEVILKSMSVAIDVLGDPKWVFDVTDTDWLARILRPILADDSDSGHYVTLGEKQEVLESRLPEGIDLNDLYKLLERYNNTLTNWESGYLKPNKELRGGENMAAYGDFSASLDLIRQQGSLSRARNYSCFHHEYNELASELRMLKSWKEIGKGTCLVATLRSPPKKETFARESFSVYLELENTSGEKMKHIDAELLITNDAGSNSSHLFSSSGPYPSGKR